MIWLRLALFVLSLLSSAGVLQQQAEYTAAQEEYEELLEDADADRMRGIPVQEVQEPASAPVSTTQWLMTGLLWGATVFSTIAGKSGGTTGTIARILEAISGQPQPGTVPSVLPNDLIVRPSDGMVDGLANLVRLANQWYGPIQTASAAIAKRGAPEEVEVLLRYKDDVLKISSGWVSVKDLDRRVPPATPPVQ
jgi:hypothetical protein